MKYLHAAAVGACCLAASAAHASEAAGQVQDIYYQAASAVLTESLHSTIGVARWADVELDAADSNGGRRILVEVPVQARVKIGDRVKIDLASDENAAVPVRRANRMIFVRTPAPAPIFGAPALIVQSR